MECGAQFLRIIPQKGKGRNDGYYYILSDRKGTIIQTTERLFPGKKDSDLEGRDCIYRDAVSIHKKKRG